MLRSVELSNFGPIREVRWPSLGGINLVIGGNSSGKTFLLKAIYSAVRTLEEHKRGDDPRGASEILSEKLYWTYQVEKLGDLASKGAESPLSFKLKLGGHSFGYSLGKSASKEVADLENAVSPRESNSIFLPAKEILSLHRIILKSREIDKIFGFDDTYVDLAKALNLPSTKGKNYSGFARSRELLHEIIGGKVKLEPESGRWHFRKGNQRFSIGVTAEGIKKIAILDTLLGNRYLGSDSIVFIDEPESALHPVAISNFLDILAILAESGMQFFLASHSYFVVKKLFLIAQEKNMSIPVIASDNMEWSCSDLKDGMPDNAIIDESIRLYEEEINLALK